MRSRNWKKYPGGMLFPAVMLCMVTLSGCGEKDRLTVYPVRGKVVYRDRGLPDATVIFHPAGADSEAAARKMHPYGETDSDGNFELHTYVEGDGVPEGEYRVIVIAPSKISPLQGGREDPNRFEQEVSPDSGGRIPQELRQKYAKADSSGITVTVTPGENELEPFVLQ